jgi:signal transduction histidine kinase
MISVNKRANHDIELIYSDDGKGISKEIQSKVFDPFFTTQRSNGGSGLGLHLVYNIVHQTLKGTLQMSSTENLGTTFTIVFPELP